MRQRMLGRGVAVVIAISGLLLAVERAQFGPAADEAPQVDTPSFSVGDEWRWEGGGYPTFVRVVAFEGGNPVVESNLDPFCRDGCRYTWDKNLVTVSGTNKKGQPANPAPLKLLQFPLHVGKEWTQDIDLRTSGGFQRPFANQWKAEAFEDVKVKAGTFKAFRITWSQQNLGPYRWTGTCSMWWSPEVKAFIKRAVHSSDWGADWQLVSYTLK